MTTTPSDKELNYIFQSSYLERSKQGDPDVTRVSSCRAAGHRALYNAGLAAGRAEQDELCERLASERRAALTVHTREGMLASEWLLRTGLAEERAKAAEQKLAALVEGLRAICNEWDGPLTRQIRALLRSTGNEP